MSPEKASGNAAARAAEKERLRERLLVMLAAFEGGEPAPLWGQFRELVARTTRLSDLKTILRELRGAIGAMTPAARLELERELAHRFGPDPEMERDAAIVAKVRARGRIQSEREYRAVQTYQDLIGADPERQAEFLVLGALLDEFSAAP